MDFFVVVDPGGRGRAEQCHAWFRRMFLHSELEAVGKAAAAAVSD